MLCACFPEGLRRERDGGALRPCSAGVWGGGGPARPISDGVELGKGGYVASARVSPCAAAEGGRVRSPVAVFCRCCGDVGAGLFGRRVLRMPWVLGGGAALRGQFLKVLLW